MTHVLVVDASRFGSTSEVATHIAYRVRVRGSDVRVCSVEDGSSVDGYAAVVQLGRTLDRTVAPRDGGGPPQSSSGRRPR